MKRIVSLFMVMLFVFALVPAMGLTASAETVVVSEDILNQLQGLPLYAWIIGAVFALLVLIWLVFLLIAIILLPFRIVFANSGKRKKKKKNKKQKAEENEKKPFSLTPEQTQKLLVVGGCVGAFSLLVNVALLLRGRD